MTAPEVDCVAIVSGGLDSVTLLHKLVKQDGRRPAVLTFNYGQKHHKELAFARQQGAALGCKHHLVLDLQQLQPLFSRSALVDAATPLPTIADVAGDPQPATYVPNRNMIFLALAAAYGETHAAVDIYYGAQRHDIYGYWDTTPDFLARLNHLLQLNRDAPLRVHAPFVDLSKADIVRLGLKLGVDYGQTWSCYAGGDVACGQCPTCSERLQAFAEVGISDPLPYADH